MSGRSGPQRARSFLRRNLGLLVLLVAAVLTAVVIAMGVNGATPRWFMSLATIL